MARSEARGVSTVPAEPGTKPIPHGTLRFYHYTNAGPGALQSIAEHGILLGKAKGDTYGEPNVVWASTEQPKQDRALAQWFKDHPDRDLLKGQARRRRTRQAPSPARRPMWTGRAR
jgi:hypothetical protein